MGYRGLMDVTDHSPARNSWAVYIHQLRGRPGWSPSRLAREAGVSRATIYRWINGESTNVTIDNVKAIAAAVGDDPNIATRAAGDLLEQNGPDAISDPDLRKYAAIMADPEISDRLKQIMRAQLELWDAQANAEREVRRAS
jgi:transcriptional regulator with XRE-family HTH domain